MVFLKVITVSGGLRLLQMVGNMFFLKVAPMKGVLRSGRKSKLSLRFIGPTT